MKTTETLESPVKSNTISIHNLHEFTDNQIIDFVAARLAEQGRKSQQEGCVHGGCLYRGPNNTKCAFGWLIPDSEFNSDMEQIGAGSVIETYFPAAENYIDLISALQNVHDGIPVDKWAAAFELLKKEREGSYIGEYYKISNKINYI